MNNQPDYKAMREEALRNPPATVQSLKDDIARLNNAERARLAAMGPDAPAILAAERSQDAANFRAREEEAGRVRQAAESKQITDAIAAKKEEAASNPTPILTAQEEAKKRYDESMRLLAEKAAAPMTGKDMQDAANIAEMRIEQRQRFDAAKAEHERLQSGLPTGKF
jgi:hypothetical protein